MSVTSFDIRCPPGRCHAGEPEVLTRRNVLYVPNTDGGADTSFGLYEENGRQLLGSALFHGIPQFLKSQPVCTDFFPSLLRPRIESAVYCGAIGDHYGHFITECFNTLWYYTLYGSPEDILLFHSNLSVDEIYARSWMAELLTYAGVRREQIVIPAGPVTIDRLLVPGQAFSEDGFVYDVYARACHKVGEVALAHARELPEGPLYLSRHRIGHGTLKLANEEALIAALERYGVTAISPEQHSVATQISALRRPLLGLIGSAFHASIFVPEPKGVVLCPGGEPRLSYVLMDAANHAAIDYVMESDVERSANVSGFVGAFQLKDPERTARELVQRLEGPVGQPKIAMPLLPVPRALVIRALYTEEGEMIVLHRPSERLFARDCGRHDVPVLAAVLGPYVFLLASDDDAPLLMIVQKTEAAPVLVYEEVAQGNAIALRNIRTRAWLKAPPSRTGLCLHGDGVSADAWERFMLRPCEGLQPQGRLADILAGLQALAETGDCAAVARQSPLLAPALAALSAL